MSQENMDVSLMQGNLGENVVIQHQENVQPALPGSIVQQNAQSLQFGNFPPNFLSLQLGNIAQADALKQQQKTVVEKEAALLLLQKDLENRERLYAEQNSEVAKSKQRAGKAVADLTQSLGVRSRLRAEGRVISIEIDRIKIRRDEIMNMMREPDFGSMIGDELSKLYID